MTELRDQFRAVLLRHSRSLVDQDGEPTGQLLDELAEVATRHAAEQAPSAAEPKPTRPAPKANPTKREGYGKGPVD
jgi:hypothetical protein